MRMYSITHLFPRGQTVARTRAFMNRNQQNIAVLQHRVKALLSRDFLLMTNRDNIDCILSEYICSVCV